MQGSTFCLPVQGRQRGHLGTKGSHRKARQCFRSGRGVGYVAAECQLCKHGWEGAAQNPPGGGENGQPRWLLTPTFQV